MGCFVGFGRNAFGRRQILLSWLLGRRYKSEVVTSNMDKPVEEHVTKKLNDAFRPLHLEIVNDSYMHNVPKGSETHFKVLIISEDFNNQPLIKRHQQVHEVLKEELRTCIHALSIVAKTPEQYQEMVSAGKTALTKSPPCQGGFGK